MSTVDQAVQTQLKNIQARTGRSLDELYAVIRGSGLSRHGQIRDMLKRDLGMGHGDANTVVHTFFQAEQAGSAGAAGAPETDPVDGIYAGKKAHLRPIHDRVLAAVAELGPFETAPKKAYVSLRRKKQFATVGPASQTRVDVGLNARGLTPSERLTELPPGGMCPFRVSLTSPEQVDAELVSWIRQAYESAG